MQEQRDAETPGQGSKSNLARDIALYTVLRLGMVAAVTAVLMQVAPVLVALAVSLVVVMPLSMLVFVGPRRRVAAGMAERAAERRARREELRAQLRGERTPDVQ
ncbi:DUF4229 domain-containing protein [Saccharopolyspora sp. K220]|uniref:DUF4229 domain-containing protein n=1 Tax=Saccharopolyspora soli TaxID=2926618 RepID=UPI001F59BB4A|nr:DUF4229 domain-containing protein [Saccharopolyspora soli]MCI2417023.1 DUF4229 domain-containing protein [Saccharopolyspora soli]